VAKPNAAFFDKLAAASGHDRHEIAYVGDRLDNDIAPASQAGLVTVWVRRGRGLALCQPDRLPGGLRVGTGNGDLLVALPVFWRSQPSDRGVQDHGMPGNRARSSARGQGRRVDFHMRAFPSGPTPPYTEVRRSLTSTRTKVPHSANR